MADLITLTAIGAGILGGIGVLWWEQALDTGGAIWAVICTVLAYIAGCAIFIAVALATSVGTTSTQAAPVHYDYAQAANAEAAQAVQIEAAVIPAPPEITNPPLPLARPVPRFRAPRRSGAIRGVTAGLLVGGRPANACPCPTAAALPPQPRPVYDYWH